MEKLAVTAENQVHRRGFQALVWTEHSASSESGNGLALLDPWKCWPEEARLALPGRLRQGE